MADAPISLLTAYNPPIATDVLAIVDVTAGVTKKITVANLLAFGLPSGTSGQTLRYDGSGNLVANDTLKNDGADVTITGRLRVTNNNASDYDLLTLRNLNSSGPSYVVYKNAAGTEKYYAGYQQANNRYLVFSGTSIGLTVDDNGRTVIGANNSAVTAADTGSMLSVDSNVGLSAYGITLRRNEGANGVPIAFKLYDSTLASPYVEYARITGVVVLNTTTAHNGKLVFSTASAGTVTDRVLIDKDGNLCPVTTGVGSLGTSSLKWLDLYLTNPLGVVYGGTGKASVAANKMLVALSANTYSETPYFDVAEQAIVTTIAFTAGTAPATPISLTYRWDQIGNRVTVRGNLLYTTAGVTVTGVLIPFPADLPAPVAPTGFSGAAAVIVYGSGGASTTITNIVANQNKSYVRRNSANTGWEIGIDTASSSAKAFYFTVTYYTT